MGHCGESLQRSNPLFFRGIYIRIYIYIQGLLDCVSLERFETSPWYTVFGVLLATNILFDLPDYLSLKSKKIINPKNTGGFKRVVFTPHDMPIIIGAFQENHTKPFNEGVLLFDSLEISQPILAHQLLFLQPIEHRWFAMILGISPSIPRIDAVEQIHSSSFTHWILYIIFTCHSYSISHILVFVGSPWCSK